MSRAGGGFNTTTREFNRPTRVWIRHRAAALSRHSRAAIEATLIYGLGESFPGLNTYESGCLVSGGGREGGQGRERGEGEKGTEGEGEKK